MLKSVRLKTWVVLGRREASTVEAISAALVLREAGNWAALLLVVVLVVLVVVVVAGGGEEKPL